MERLWSSICQPCAAGQRGYTVVIAVLLLAEVLLGYLIINYRQYTEIDWIAYMQEVEGVLGGDFDYANLRGQTGPLVYPAGFVWIYSLLHYMTVQGSDIRAAQYIFLALYWVTTLLVFLVYREFARSECSNWKFHVKRGFALTLPIVSSVALSIKMNILLFIPGLLVLLVKAGGLLHVFPSIIVIGVVQILLGLPFLLHEPYHYQKGAFDFGRQFLYVWSVNFKFVPEDIFLSKHFATSLLIGHVCVLVLFAAFKWCSREEGGPFGVLFREKTLFPSAQRLSASHIVAVLISSNFIGIVFARSLHYQFYVWYFHSIPLLLWITPLPVVSKLLVQGVIEAVWMYFPSDAYSSATLMVCHMVMLLGVLCGDFPSSASSSSSSSSASSSRKKRNKKKTQ